MGVIVATWQLEGVWNPGATVTVTVSVSHSTTSWQLQLVICAPAEASAANARAPADASENFILKECGVFNKQKNDYAEIGERKTAGEAERRWLTKSLLSSLVEDGEKGGGPAVFIYTKASKVKKEHRYA